MPFNSQDAARSRFRVQPVIQGEYRISDQPDVVFSTILGSCVSVGLFDPVAGIGGLNHYLLPDAGEGGRSDVKYGAMAIELLINELLKAGASRTRLRAKLCGGANIISALGNIGARNAEFGRDFMRREGFPIVAEDLGGVNARRLQFQPTTGNAKVFSVPAAQNQSIAAKERAPHKPKKPDVTLF
ncbi:MAG: chemotaxis protein CheD [Rhodobiaceae bacterium]|jgi:chemotaxis protein CheD|nr:chemotaxis protein CheD [Rhodobiaceae bacterium]